MTILSPQTLLNFIDLVADGISISEATIAIGGSPKSKIVFVWLKASEEAAAFETPAAVTEPWCVTRDGTPQWFHIAYREAVASKRAAPRPKRAAKPSAMRADLETRLTDRRAGITTPPDPSAMRADLETRLAAKRAGQPPAVEPSMAEQQLPPRMIVDHVRQEPVSLDPPPPKVRPSYAYRSKPLDAANTEPPAEGRFVMQTQHYTKRQLQSGKPEITELGVKWN